MLLWEAVRMQSDGWDGLDRSDGSDGRASSVSGSGAEVARMRRLPFETRCAAMTQSGRRCRGRIRKGTEFCPFHDPTVSRERRRQNASKGGRSHCRLAHLPDGYLRKLTSRRAAGEAMDRLYREVRLGIITPEMGSVLFGVLARLLDSGLCDTGRTGTASSRRSQVDKTRRALWDLLTRAERAAWRRAVASVPETLAQGETPKRATSAVREAQPAGSRAGVALQVAS